MLAAGPDTAVVCGDVNIAPTDADVFDPDAYIGQTHVTPRERQALAEIQALRRSTASVFTRLGFSPEQVKAFLANVLAFLKERLPEEVMKQIRAQSDFQEIPTGSGHDASPVEPRPLT